MFVALDVETANSSWGSICQIGLVMFDEGGVRDEWSTLIDPLARFSRGNIRVHGITPTHVRGAPTFEEASREIFDRIEDRIVIAHNASFDRTAVRYAAGDAGLHLPECRWLCSVRVARRAWAGELKRFGLSHVARHLGMDFGHHDALEDARAAAHVVLAACERTGLSVEGWMERVEQPVARPTRRRVAVRHAPSPVAARVG